MTRRIIDIVKSIALLHIIWLVNYYVIFLTLKASGSPKAEQAIIISMCSAIFIPLGIAIYHSYRKSKNKPSYL